MNLWLLQVTCGAQVAPCLCGCQLVVWAAGHALALLWLLVLPSWEKSGYLDHRRVDIPEQPPALSGSGCHQVAMVFSGWFSGAALG